jgi:acyl carrier protein
VLKLGRRQRHPREKRSTITEEIRRVLGEHARLTINVADLSDTDDLFRLGMTSHASVSVMLALEDAFGVEFPEPMLKKSTFESIASIANAITEMLGRASAD